MLPAIHLGPLTLHTYGLLVLAGFLAGIWLATRLARQQGLQADVFWEIASVLLLLSIVGARLVFVLLNGGYFLAHPLESVMFWKGGLSVHGGVSGGILGGWLATRRLRLPFGPYADVAAPGIAIGQVLGRFGCLLNGCCYGAPTTLPWGIAFVAGSPTHYLPAQLFEASGSLALMGLLIWRLRRPHAPGQVLAVYALGYSFIRFLVEFARRGQTVEVIAGGLTEAQIASLVIGAGAALTYYWLGRRRQPQPVPVASAPASQ